MIGAFKLRDANTGLYSSGGMKPKFSKLGKTWRTRGHLMQHLSLLNNQHVSGLSYAASVRKRMEEDTSLAGRYQWYKDMAKDPIHPYAACELEIVSLKVDISEAYVQAI